MWSTFLLYDVAVERCGVYGDGWGNVKGGDHLKDLDIGGSIVSHGVLKKQNGRVWIGFVCYGIEINGLFLLAL